MFTYFILMYIDNERRLIRGIYAVLGNNKINHLYMTDAKQQDKK